MPNGTGVSNIDLSRSPSHSLSLLHFHSALSFSSFLSLHRCTELGCEQLEGEGGGEGRGKEGFTRKSQPKPRSGGHSPVEQTHAHAPTTDAKLCPDRSPSTFKFHHFFFPFFSDSASASRFYPISLEIEHKMFLGARDRGGYLFFVSSKIV